VIFSLIFAVVRIIFILDFVRIVIIGLILTAVVMILTSTRAPSIVGIALK